MGSGIFSIRDDNLTELDLAPFEAEDIFQELLSKYPGLIAGDQIDGATPRRWLLVRREMSVPDEENGSGRWSLDHLFLDQDGIPTLVEVKRSTDTRLRREVVGQMLDYAANAIVYWPVETIQSEFQFRCEQDDRPADQELADFLDDETDPDSFWAAVKTNLQAGKVRMLFVADEVPRELRRIIEFLNTQMDPAQVLALEIHRYRGDGQQTLVSRVIGQTAEAERKKGGNRLPSRKWNEASFFAAIDDEHAQLRDSIRLIYDRARENNWKMSWGRGAKYGSFQMSVGDHTPNLIFVYNSGSLEFSREALGNTPPFTDPAFVEKLHQRLNDVNGIMIAWESWDKAWIVVKLQDLAGQKEFLELIAVLEWLLDEVMQYEFADDATV